MRLVCLLALLIAVPLAHPQTSMWNTVDISPQRLNPTLPAAKLTTRQKAAIHKLIVHTLSDDCATDPEGLGTFTYSIAPIGRPHVVYVSPGPGCLRGGQGANASLWLIDTSAPKLRILASPGDGFEGWGLGVQPHLSHGLHDLVTGWHMSADEFTLSYLRFDGTHYRTLDHTTIMSCASIKGHENESGRCLQNGRHALDSGTD